jgi:hypothetical protein
MNKDTYTKVFLHQAGQSIGEANVKIAKTAWWMNNRSNTENSLRLTDAGMAFLQHELDLEVYEIPFPASLDLKPQVIIYLDRFMDSPYYLTKHSIIVLNERKAFELHLFAGDVQKYGLTKAINRKKDTK